MSDNLKPGLNKDIYDGTPSKSINDFMAPNDSSSEKPKNNNVNLNFQGAVDSASIDENNNSMNIFEKLSRKDSRPNKEREIKKNQDRSASSIPNSQNAIKNKIEEEVGKTNLNKEINLIGKENELFNVEFDRSKSNANPSKKYFNLVNRKPFALKKASTLMIRQKNMDQICKLLVNCSDSLKTKIMKYDMGSKGFLDNMNFSCSLQKANLHGVLEEINKYYEDQFKNKLRQNRFLEKEAIHNLEKASFNNIKEIISKYIGEDNNHPLHQFLDKNGSRFIDKINLNDLMKEIEEIIRLQEENLVKFSTDLKENAHLEKNKIEIVSECLQKCGNFVTITVEKCKNINKSCLKECEKTITNIKLLDYISVCNVIEKSNFNPLLKSLREIHFKDIMNEENKNISVDDLNQFESSIQQRNEGISLSNQNPFLESLDGEIQQHMSVLEPADEGLKSIIKHSQKNSIDEISRLEQLQTPIKAKRVTPEKTSDIIGTDPKHQYVSNRLRRTLSVFNNFNKEVDELINFPQTLSKKVTIPNISSIKKLDKVKDSLNKNMSVNRSGSCRNSVKKSLNFNSIRENIVKKVKESIKSNSVDSPRLKITELELETDTPRFLRTDLISKLLSFSEEDLKNIAMKNVSPQKPLPKQKCKEPNNLQKFVFSNQIPKIEEKPVQYTCQNKPNIVEFKENEKNIKYDNEIPQYKAILKKYSSTYNIKSKKELSLHEVSGSLAKTIQFSFNEYQKNEKNFNLDYSLTQCKLNTLVLNINIPKLNNYQPFIVQSNSTSININQFLNQRNNKLSYSSIVKMMIYFLKVKTNEEHLHTMANRLEQIINEIETINLASKLKSINLEKINKLILRSVEIIDLLLVGIKEYDEMNKEIKASYLNIDILKTKKILSVVSENKANINLYSVLDIASFYIKRFKDVYYCLKRLSEIREDLRNKFMNEAGRLHSFKSNLNVQFISNLDKSFQDNFNKAVKSSGDCRNLIEISKKIEEHDKRLPSSMYDIREKVNGSSILESESKMSSGEKHRNQRSVIIHPSAQKDLSLFVCGDENSILTYKLNNFELKNLKKKQIIENLRSKEIESLSNQSVKEAERIQQLEKEKEKLIKQSKIGKTSHLDYLNSGLLVLILFFLILTTSNFYTGFKGTDQYPVELIINE